MKSLGGIEDWLFGRFFYVSLFNCSLVYQDKRYVPNDRINYYVINYVILYYIVIYFNEMNQRRIAGSLLWFIFLLKVK